jgi:hypothetical protein
MDGNGKLWQFLAVRVMGWKTKTYIETLKSSGNYTYHLLQQSLILRFACKAYLRFFIILWVTIDYFPNGINLSIFVMVMVYAFFEVRSERLNMLRRASVSNG